MVEVPRVQEDQSAQQASDIVENRPSMAMNNLRWFKIFSWRTFTLLDRCSTCAAFSCRIGKPMDEQQKADILHAQKEHLNLVAQYRAVQTRLNHMSEESCNAEPGSSLGNGVLKIDMDFCDQSKFKIPRNQTSSKSLDHLWRPQMSVACALVWGAA